MVAKLQRELPNAMKTLENSPELLTQMQAMVADYERNKGRYVYNEFVSPKDVIEKMNALLSLAEKNQENQPELEFEKRINALRDADFRESMRKKFADLTEEEKIAFLEREIFDAKTGEVPDASKRPAKSPRKV
jgi:hypothetical protein